MDVFRIAESNQLSALKIIEECQLIQAWEKIGATVHIVGACKTGLMKERDIDLHIYTDKLDISDSFSVMQGLAKKLNLKEIQYKNLIHTEEECIEWHALYEDEQINIWKFDMIHIRAGSKYDGRVEGVTEAIIKRLTPDIRRIILQIKFDIPDNVRIPGIEIYQAVFSGNVNNYEEFIQWHKKNPLENSLDWMP